MCEEEGFNVNHLYPPSTIKSINKQIVLPELLPELWVQIVSNLNCDMILVIKLTSKFFNNLVNKNDLYMKKKMLGFPRKQGFCECHDLSQFAEFADAD